LKYFSLFTIKD